MGSDPPEAVIPPARSHTATKRLNTNASAEFLTDFGS